MKILLILCLVLAGCASTYKDTEVLTRTEYVVRRASSSQKELPQHSANINVETATQLDLANWIAETEERQLKLESIIKELINFYEAPIAGVE